jgi:hypothetical protein
MLKVLIGLALVAVLVAVGCNDDENSTSDATIDAPGSMDLGFDLSGDQPDGGAPISDATELPADDASEAAVDMVHATVDAEFDY